MYINYDSKRFTWNDNAWIVFYNMKIKKKYVLLLFLAYIPK